MAKRQSTIDILPADILEKLQELLRDPRVTQLGATAKINAILEAEGHEERLSKSAVNRYDLRMREVGNKLQQSRAIAEMWIGKFGSQPQGKIGNLVNEMLRGLAFDLALKLQESDISDGNIPDIVSQLKSLSLTVQRLESASALSDKREREIREETKQEAAKEVGKIAKTAGLSDDNAELIRNKILGINQ